MTGTEVLAGGSGLPSLRYVPTWLGDSANWSGINGVPTLVRQQLTYTALAVVIALVIALPLGLWIGHTGRGVAAIGGVANAVRAVPVLGLLLFLVVWLSPKIHHTAAVTGLVQRGGFPYFVPLVIVLVVLAIPPILTNSYAGVQNVDPEVRDAARGMGMTGWQVVQRVEFPCALPLIMSGLRSATLQVLATATIAAYVPLLGGLGSLIYIGDQSITDPHTGYPVMVAAGLLVAILAVLVDVALVAVQTLIVSPGLSGRYASKNSDLNASTTPTGEAVPVH
ncbi:MAG: osmoprotectant transport system permease protein [Frankiales bacterium]|jgi:osmoprotectant transport system permease protein|nr:osmoprotectant transport system permease protein [Frankiales bacterium]